MEPNVFWLVGFVLAYWLFCIFYSAQGMGRSRSAVDFFIAGRATPFWIFVVAATATSFSGATFIGHPGLIYSDGFQYAFTSFYAIMIPFTGVLFLKRQWMIGKRFGFVTPGEMFAAYFRSDVLRLLVVLVALLFTVPLIGLSFRASGQLVVFLTDAGIDLERAVVALSVVVGLYVALGGLAGVARVATLQGLLFVAGIATLAALVLQAVGGPDAFSRGLEVLGELDDVRTLEGHSHYLAVPGVMQMVPSGTAAEGGPWTAMMIFSYMLALMGIQAAPVFTMWAFASRDPAPFASQQVWASAFVVGFLLIVLAAVQGLGGHLLGANPVMNDSPLARDVVVPLLPELRETESSLLVPYLIQSLSPGMPWLMGFLAVAAIAAMQSTGAVYLSTLAGLITRDVVKHFIVAGASHMLQRFYGRMLTVGVLVLSVLFALYSEDTLVVAGGLAVAIGLQMWPALIAICYVPWLTRSGITLGLILGIIAVIATEKIGGEIATMLGYALPWGRWPLTLHSGFWGLAVNLTTAILVSALTQSREAYEHRMRFHSFLRTYAALSPAKRALIPAGWIITVVWVFFAIGPGLVTGNTIFGDPNEAGTWVFGIPSIWAWQILFWGLGVLVLWFLAYQLEMSTPPRRRVEALVDDIGDLGEDPQDLRV